jgi:hypothetical protein
MQALQRVYGAHETRGEAAMNPVEDMIQAYVAFVDGVITKEEYHVHHKEFCKHSNENPCHNCGGKNIVALFEDARFREAVLKHKGEERGQDLIKSGLTCGKDTHFKCVCGKGE